MINIREFIRKLGDTAPSFFGTKEATIARWLKTGSIPMKAVEKVLAAQEAIKAMEMIKVEQPPQVAVPAPVASQPDVDPLTHLPVDLDRRLPQIQANPGHAPQVIEMSPTEQNWGVNLTRPGRVTGPMPPMKIRKVNGQNVPYVEQPEPVKTLPPEIGGGEAGWNKPYESPDKKDTPKGVSQEKVS